MSKVYRVILSFILPAIFVSAPSRLWALEKVTGANLTADMGFGARQQGMGLMHSGFQDGADAVINAPAAMNDVNDLTFSTSHLEQFEAAQFDALSLLIPWHADGTLGLAMARYGVGNIESHNLAALPDSVTGEFSTADWLLSGSFARRFGALDLGGTLHLLYRNLGDQSGMGLRADVMGQYTFTGGYRMGVFVRGLVPSTAKYQSGWTEYEPPEASLFASGLWAFPYFYGNLQAGFETPGLVQQGARSANELEGSRAITDPVSLLKTSKAGGEFRFDFGLKIRAGLDELKPSTLTSSIRLGAGYGWKNIVGVDYAFSAHPSLGQSHRVALWWTPSFPKFEGRGFRPHPAGSPQALEKRAPEAKSSDEEAPSEMEEKGTTPSDEAPPEKTKSRTKEILEDE